MPISIQMALAFYVAAINPLIISSLPSIGRDYIYLDSREPTEYNAICHRSLDHLLYLYVRVIVIVLTTVLLAYTGGVYAMLVNDRAATLFGFSFFGIELGSDLEYRINVCLQFTFAVYFPMGNIGLQQFALMFENAIKTDMLLIEADLRQFARDLCANRLTAHGKKERLAGVLRSILRSNEWIIRFNGLVYWRHFLPPFAITYSIGFCILCQYNVGCSFTMLDRMVHLITKF